MAEEAGIYVHPTGLDHWEEMPAWAKVDRIADEHHLRALEMFWKLAAANRRSTAANTLRPRNNSRRNGVGTRFKQAPALPSAG